jgi:hypothetical protein
MSGQAVEDDRVTAYDTQILIERAGLLLERLEAEIQRGTSLKSEEVALMASAAGAYASLAAAVLIEKAQRQ